MSLSEKQKLIRVAYLKHRFADPSLAYDNYSDEDLAFEKMSDEMLADSKRNLQNPRMTGCDPHKSPGKGSGDGECYQVHQDYGKAKSGDNGSPRRRKYMVNYRKKYYDSKNKRPKDGMGTRKIVPKPYPKKTPPKHPIGKLDRSKVEKKKKEEMSKKAQLISELQQERMNLLKMAYENPSLRGEIMPLLKKKAAPAYRKNKSEHADKNCQPLKIFDEWGQKGFDDYFKDLFNDVETRGNCYSIYNEYGKAPSGDGKRRKETGKSGPVKRQKYHDWYNENVRGRGGKTTSPITRSQDNARKMFEDWSEQQVKGGKEFLFGYIKHLKEERSKSLKEIREIIGPKLSEKYLPERNQRGTSTSRGGDDFDWGGGGSSSGGSSSGGSSSSGSSSSKKKTDSGGAKKKTDSGGDKSQRMQRRPRRRN